VPPPVDTGGECLVIWDGENGETLPAALEAWLRERFGVEVPGARPIVRVAAPYRHTSREYRAYFVRLPDGSGQCR
jgi:hypothetical protein